MKIIVFLLLIVQVFFAREFYSKAKPYEQYDIASDVSGKVLFVNTKAIGTVLSADELIVKLDDEVDLIDMEQSKLKLKNMKKIYSIESSILDSFKKVSSKSKYDKKNEHIKVLNVQSNIFDITTKLSLLKHDIKSKNLNEKKDTYVSDIYVTNGDFVNKGTLLYRTYDLSQAKLEFFVPISISEDIKSKTIYLDDVKTDFVISKLHKVANDEYITSYKCEIIIPTPENFSKIIRIDFR
jgi:hypothetical protein